VPNSQLKEFEEAVGNGQMLMMIDVPKDRVEDITGLVKKHHPDADMHGTEPTMPAFP